MRHFDEELKRLKEKLFRMGILVESAVDLATASLFERDSEKAHSVIAGDKDINLYEIEIDEISHELIARFQPTAADLRLITMVLKVNNDLERMGDQAVNIAEKAIVINQESPLKPYQDLPKMAVKVKTMLREALTSFMERDLVKAQAILEGDDEVDQFNDKIYHEIEEILKKRPEMIRTGISLIVVSHNLERIADLATNVAEDVIFLKKGIDIRHHIRERRNYEEL